MFCIDALSKTWKKINSILTTQLLQKKNQISDDYKYNFYLPKGQPFFKFFFQYRKIQLFSSYVRILLLIGQFWISENIYNIITQKILSYKLKKIKEKKVVFYFLAVGPP